MYHADNMSDMYQSAYRKYHSTETALLCVTNDIKLAMDSKKGTILVMIDLSSAFDTIDHSILLSRLELRYGITSVVLEWFRSYLYGRVQRINIDDSFSPPHPLTTGVPQGSVLGPLLFSLYVQPLGGIIREHSIQFHHYADDLQLYAHFDLNKSSLESTISRMQDCIGNVQLWLSNNKLKMNPDKTLFIAFVPPYYNTLVDNININIGSSDINVVSSVTNLGVRLDRNLKMTTQTSHLMSSCAYQLKLVNSIRASLDVQVAERVVNAIFTSRLDYCNSLLAGLTVQDFTRLQRLQNAAARCVLMRPRDFSATDMLCELHWLPVRKRVDYKLLLLTYKTLNGSAPEYLVNQLQDYCPTRALRSGDQNLLSVKKTRIKIGDSSFAVAASVLWNALPCQIKKARTIDCFKSMIKTHLFKL